MSPPMFDHEIGGVRSRGDRRRFHPNIEHHARRQIREITPGCCLRESTGRDRFQISVALAGFTPDEVALTVEQNVLTLEGQKAEKDEKTFVHRGMSTRSFKRQFTLADHVEVKGARFENGLLVIELQREIPETMKPRRIAITGASTGQAKQIEGKAA